MASSMLFRKPDYMQRIWKSVMEARYQMCVCCFLAVFSAYVERTGFSIAYTKMCTQDGVPDRVKGAVMSSFYWGYVISQFPGGWMAQLYGGRIMLIISFAGWSVVSLLTPTSALHSGVLSICRVLIGLSQGLMIPSVHTVLSEWVLPHERAKATSMVTSGMYLGSATAMQVLPALGLFFGSAAVIPKFNGLFGLAWLLVWICVGREVKHRDGLIPMTTMSHQGSSRKMVPKPPWAQIMGHQAVWAIVLNNFTFHYSFYMVMNWLPTYFNALIGIDLDEIGIGKPVPYIVMFLMSNAGGWLGDWIISKGYAVATARKIVNCLGFWGSGFFLMLMPFATTTVQGLVLVSATLGCLGLARGGFSVNHMDIAPRYAGVLMGISNTAGTISGIVGVALTGLILERAGGSEERSGWVMAHTLSTGMGVAGSFFFILAAQGERLFG